LLLQLLLWRLLLQLFLLLLQLLLLSTSPIAVVGPVLFASGEHFWCWQCQC
jgi:hypothetical protein